MCFGLRILKPIGFSFRLYLLSPFLGLNFVLCPWLACPAEPHLPQRLLGGSWLNKCSNINSFKGVKREVEFKNELPNLDESELPCIILVSLQKFAVEKGKKQVRWVLELVVKVGCFPLC